MTKDIVKNADSYWFDDDGNSLVVSADGKVYLVIFDDGVHYVTDDIRKIYDEEADDYVIGGMSIYEYISSMKKDETVLSEIEQPTETVASIPAQVVYQTIYHAPETEKNTYMEESEFEET